ncbi:alkane 1-monooxygenase [Rhodococcus rhodochrous]|uniref:alkane 1-monooxygenase n=1 Tax=Rhodococcus rhodochrous TaxID=1829 RepID=UPI0027E114FF|nr:alkane 1-monooxygenase [Rhodococcus rhodochrous]MCB8914115.1 alkane 1-monooxygenase [Rhodococcus rhodochrous]
MLVYCKDPYRYLWLCALIIPGSPFLAWVLVHWFNLGVFWATGALVIAVLVPIVDKLAGMNKTNLPEEALRALEQDRYYRWCTYAYLPLQYAGVVFACWAWTTAPMGLPEQFALAATVGVVGGVGINAAHELGHQRVDLEQRLAKIALAQSGYGHFFVEHNHGHHLRVATPDDPASARYGESYWRFLPRSVFGGVRSGWRYERERLARRGRPWWSLRHNNVLQGWVLTAMLFVVLIAVFGWSVAPWLAIQAVMAVIFLEAANYLEHYGLLRSTRPDGSFERVAPRHSWNSDHRCSNLFLYHLQRHSDHHANPRRRYQTLRSMREAPQLPAGYAMMILLAFVPPLWRTVMDKRLLAHYDQDLTRVNLSPERYTIR